MTELLAALALTVSDSFVLSLALKATLILALALACAHGVPRARASRRFVVVAWAFVIVGSLPVIALFGRPLTVVVREAPSALPVSAAPIQTPMPVGNPPLTDARDGPLRSVLSSQPDMGLTWTELVAIVWAVGFLRVRPTDRRCLAAPPAPASGGGPMHRTCLCSTDRGVPRGNDDLGSQVQERPRRNRVIRGPEPPRLRSCGGRQAERASRHDCSDNQRGDA